MLLGGNSNFLYVPPIEIQEMKPASNNAPVLHEDTVDPFPNFASEIEQKIEYLVRIFGEEITIDRMKQVLQGADGNVEIALNHLLNDQEKSTIVVETTTTTTTTITKSPSLNSITPSATEKLLYELAEEVKCPLCLGYFTNPVILGCFHTFCFKCLEDIVTQNKLSCPMCRADFDLEEKGVKGLKSNHYLANIVEKLKSAQNTRMCDECRNALCTVICKECKAFLCVTCNDRIHSIRLLFNHIIIPFEECFFTSRSSSSVIGTEVNINWETDLVIPFNVKKEVCTNLFYSWVKELWFAPSDLAGTAFLQDFKMVYVPYWLFEVDTSSKYIIGFTDKLLGESSEGGVYKQRYTDLIICASNCPESALLDQIDPWKMDQIQPFTLLHSEGAEVLPFTMDVDSAWRLKAKQKIENMNHMACRNKLQFRYRSDRCDSANRLHVESTFENKRSKRLFVPVYSTIYEYHGNTYRFIVNGSTAKAYGNRPYSTSKLASLSLSGFGAAVGLFSSSRFNPI